MEFGQPNKVGYGVASCDVLEVDTSKTDFVIFTAEKPSIKVSQGLNEHQVLDLMKQLVQWLTAKHISEK